MTESTTPETLARADRVPVEEWTDEEWLAVLRTVPFDADASIGEMAVAEMRGRRNG